MLCPICQKRKAKRFCPAKAATICSVCCGTEREVTIDCPADCLHLIESRRYDLEHSQSHDRKMPFKEPYSPEPLMRNEALTMQIWHSTCELAAKNPALVDADVQAAAQALAETYRTLASGVVYEQPPAYPIRRELYERLRNELDGAKRRNAGDLLAKSRLRDSELRDFLIAFTQLATLMSNGRPKGRAFLDFMRSQFKPGTFSREESKIILA